MTSIGRLVGSWDRTAVLGIMLMFLAGGCGTTATSTDGRHRAPASTASTSSPAATDYVPWTDAPGVFDVDTRPSPSPPVTRPCRLTDLVVTEGSYGALTGNTLVYGWAVHNRSASECVMELDGDARFLDARNRDIAATPNPGELPGDGFLDLPGAASPTDPLPRVSVLFGPICSVAPLAEVVVTLRGSGDQLALRRQPEPDDGSRCTDYPKPRWAVALNGPPPAPPPEAGIIATISEVSAVRPGGRLRYLVTLANPSGVDVTLPSCPAYREMVKASAGATDATYALNCGGSLALHSGASVRYEMLLSIPATLAPGKYGLFWEVDLEGPQLAHAIFTVSG